MSDSDNSLQPGSTFGKHRIVRLLGRGGMGEVYEVEHELTGKRHALKLLSADVMEVSGALERFEREAKVMARLEHPGIVRVDLTGEDEGRHWLRMEMMPGREVQGKRVVTLEEFVEAKGGRLPETEVKKLTEEMLEALGHAHGQGLVHRDLKPANVLLDGERLKIADFGLVNAAGADWMDTQIRSTVINQDEEDTLIDDGSGTGSRSRAIMGTYSFMSPEQKKGQPADARSDLYAVGLMVFRMLTGEESPGFKLPSRIIKDIDPGWDDWVERCMETNPSDRFPNAGEMKDALSFKKTTVPPATGSKPTRQPSPERELPVPDPVAKPQAPVRKAPVVRSPSANNVVRDGSAPPKSMPAKAKIWPYLLGVVLVALAGLFAWSTWETDYGIVDYEETGDHGEVFVGMDGSTYAVSIDEPEQVILDTVAVLTKTVGVEWSEEASIKPELGNTLEPCTLKLESGLVQIEFLQGSTVVLEGSVEFEIVNPNGGALRFGKLRASVPQVATGFTIEVPHGKIIDLGTEFGLHVHKGGSTEVFVYKGRVLYEGNAGEDGDVFREISGGESIFIDPYGHPRWVEMPTEPFMDSTELAYRSMEESQRRHAAWVQFSKEIARNPKTRLYFTFDNQDDWSRVLLDASTSSQQPSNGAVIGCKWEEGRWAGKGALAFKRDNDRVRLNLAKHLSSASLAAWIKIDALPKSIAPIICTEPLSLGATCWSINKQGQLSLRVKSVKGFELYESAVAFGTEHVGRWTHVATTLDSESKMISHYVNGRSFSHEKMAKLVPLSFEKSFLGHACDMPDLEGIALRGSIDEFVLFEEAYQKEEIRRIYEVGRPYEPTSPFGSNSP